MVSRAPAPGLIGIDWGSSGLRVFLVGRAGAVLDQRSTAQGSSSMNGVADNYARALQDIAGDWISAWPALPLLACGMVGSQHGWREVPYVDGAAGAGALGAGAASVAMADGRRVWIVPGLRCTPPGAPPDVMRGEETQIAGALAARPDWVARSCIVMPGTHSKWAQMVAGEVRTFATYMTGELFAVLRGHTVLGRLMPDAPGETDWAAFDTGVEAGRGGAGQSLSHQLFAVRTLGLSGAIPCDGLGDYLSGLLIGHELQGGLDWRARAGLAGAPLALVGDEALCGRYARALRQCGVEPAVLPNTAPAGLWHIARTMGLVDVTVDQPEMQQ
jgi:2-dehydro-3-deoxygalactonokinase